MSEELTMPRLSDTMEEGTIARWAKSEGDSFARGELIAEIQTDKATMDFNAYADGTLLKILVADGESVALGAPIAIVGEPGEQVEAGGGGDEAAAGARPEPAEEDTAAEPLPSQDEAAGDGGGPASTPAGDRDPAGDGAAEAAGPAAHAGAQRVAAGGAGLRVSPIARRMAEEAGVDLSELAGRGSGPEGRVVKVDVERLIAGGGNGRAAAPAAEPRPAAAAGEAAPAAAELREPSSMLKAVARRMVESSTTVPHFYVTVEIDMTRAMALRREVNEGLAESGEKVSVNDLVVRACARALIEHPQAHRSWIDGKLAYHEHANVGIAVALEDGLIVPVLREADTLGLREIARATRDLAGRARELKLKQQEIEGGTFTVSNLGMFDVSQFDAIINPPESGILAVGAVVERPVVRDGEIVARPMMTATLSCDHRACSGADGARLLQTVKRLLQGGALLLA